MSRVVLTIVDGTSRVSSRVCVWKSTARFDGPVSKRRLRGAGYCEEQGIGNRHGEMDKAIQNGTIRGNGSEAVGKVSETSFGSEGGRHAVVGVLYENKQFLVIRRSLKVRAPGLICFPGGGIEAGESLVEAVKRELFEEINLSVGVVGHLWTSQTRWGAKLEWMLCQRVEGDEPEANPEEVSEVIWMTAAALLGRDDLLGSMPDFLAEYDRGRFAGFLVS